MRVKHNFKVNQVWASEKHPEKSIFIYQLYCPDVNEEFHEPNEDSFYAAVLINKSLFYDIVRKYQEEHNIKDRTSTYPYCIFKEGTINSLKRYIKQWECELIGEENFTKVEFDNGDLITIEEEGDAIDEVWEKYSK